jgi:replicative DNA helicase
VSDDNGNGQPLPPEATDCEQLLLGALFTDPDALSAIAGDLEISDFYRKTHGLIYQAMIDLRSVDDPIHPSTVSQYLRGAEQLDLVGGRAYLTELCTVGGPPSLIPFYAREIKEMAVRRGIRTLGKELHQGELEADGSEEVLTIAGMKLQELAKRALGDGHLSTEELAHSVFNDILDRTEKGPSGIPIGLGAVQSLTYGFHPGNLIIIAARPSVGKTGFAVGVAEHIASVLRQRVAFFSLEMTSREIGERFMARIGRINGNSLRSGKLTKEEADALVVTTDKFSRLPIDIFDDSGMSVARIEAAVDKLFAQGKKVAAVFVDYLQLMSGPETQKRHEFLSECTKALKRCAKRWGVPVVALSQLNRETGRRPNKRPTLFDLKESGAIEEDADLVIGLHQHAEYDETWPKEVAEAIILKQRNGPKDTAYIKFVPEYAGFFDLEYNFRPPAEPAKPSKYKRGESGYAPED